MNLLAIVLTSLVNTSLLSPIEENKGEHIEKDFHFYWEKGNNWMQLGYNYTISCYLQHTGSGNFRAHDDDIHIIPPRYRNFSKIDVSTKPLRLNRHLLIADLEVKQFMAEDEGVYECVWTRKNKEPIVIKKHIHNMTEKAKVEILERSPYHLQLEEGESFSLSARDTIYPKEKKGYKVQWSRVYKLATQAQNSSNLISKNVFMKMSSVTNKAGYYTEKLDVRGAAVTTDMSGTYVLTITYRDTVEVLEWNVEIENKEADVELVVNGPQFNVLNSTFYPPGAVLSITCVSLSIPKADVFIEAKNRENANYEVVDQSQMTEILGTYENGYRWNTTFSKNTQIKCTSRKNKKKATIGDHILLADGNFEISYKHTINDKLGLLREDERLYEGDDVYLRCIVPNVPGWNASWFFLEQQIRCHIETKSHSKLLSLNLRNVSLANSGTYKCVLENEITEDSLEKTVIIHKSIKPFAIARINTKTIVEHYKNFSLDCGLTGTPKPIYQWKQNGRLLFDEYNKILTVSRASKEDNGKIECEAQNRAGSAKTVFDVEVTNIPRKNKLWMKITMIGSLGVLLSGSFFFGIRFFSSRKAIKTKFFPVLMEPVTRQTTVQSDVGVELLPRVPIRQNNQQRTPSITNTILPENLERQRTLGSGNFGVVYKGLLTSYPLTATGHNRFPVAIKEINPNSDNDESNLINLLLDELKVMLRVKKHPNVLALIGCSTENNRPSLVFEYIECGSLKDYLVKHRDMFFANPVVINSEGEDNDYLVTDRGPLTPIYEKDLISFSMQIANGMCHLASIPCVHRDLALRNILVTKERIVRIADFGLAKINTNKDYYRPVKKYTSGLPLHLTAPECFYNPKFTEKSDVWAFAICLYEIFTLGGNPYPGIRNVLEHVKNGGYNDKSEHCPDEIYEFMKSCWHQDPNERPNFEECLSFFKSYLSNVSEEMVQEIVTLLEEETQKQEEMSKWI